MVFLGTQDLQNVSVLPGGEEIISDSTFPEYFLKKELQNKDIDTYKDIESFALKVAPKFEICRRYFGEEPLDNVTRQYNEQMKYWLPVFNIETREIPRCQDKRGVISATRVRNAYDRRDWSLISDLVPHSTLKYLKQLAAN